MAARSLNKVMLIGNLTRDPELRYTPSGTPVCSFGVATNREWVDSSGQKQEGAEFHNIVAWGKLGEICDQLLNKGRKVYLEGRLSTRTWKGQDEVERRTTEIVIDEMVALDSPRGRRDDGGAGRPAVSTKKDDVSVEIDTELKIDGEGVSLEAPVVEKKSTTPAPASSTEKPKEKEKDLAAQVADDIPF